MNNLILFIEACKKGLFSGIVAGVTGLLVCCILSLVYFGAKILIVFPIAGKWVGKPEVSQTFFESNYFVFNIGPVVAIVFFAVAFFIKFKQEF